MSKIQNELSELRAEYDAQLKALQAIRTQLNASKTKVANLAAVVAEVSN